MLERGAWRSPFEHPVWFAACSLAARRNRLLPVFAEPEIEHIRGLWPALRVSAHLRRRERTAHTSYARESLVIEFAVRNAEPVQVFPYVRVRPVEYRADVE